jgi:hypothetical protein
MDGFEKNWNTAVGGGGKLKVPLLLATTLGGGRGSVLLTTANGWTVSSRCGSSPTGVVVNSEISGSISTREASESKLKAVMSFSLRLEDEEY